MIEQHTDGSGTQRAELRICMPTFSAVANQAFRSGLREAQDILVECGNVDLVHLEPAASFTRKASVLAPLYYKDPFRIAAKLNPGLKPVELERDYDLFVAVLPYWRDMAYLNAIVAWRKRCKLAICWIDELWISEVRHLHRWLYVLDQFDHVFVGNEETGQVLSAALGRTCHDLAGAVDTLRFCPMPEESDRTVDVFSLGRRNPEVHKSLLRLASKNSLFYLHDTTQSGNSPVSDHREHRQMYANIAKRSRLFMVAPGKIDATSQTNGQVDIGFRYFEGLAAGAVLAGTRPRCELFEQLFDWPDSVLELADDGSDVERVIPPLLADGDMLREVSRRNAIAALRKHDWIHRWKRLFELSGQQPITGILTREQRLRDLADASER